MSDRHHPQHPRVRVRYGAAILAGTLGWFAGYGLAATLQGLLGGQASLMIPLTIGLLVAGFAVKGDPSRLVWRLVAGAVGGVTVGAILFALNERTRMDMWGAWLWVFDIVVISGASVGAAVLAGRIARGRTKGVGDPS